ncbi:thioredoxin family protein [Chitinophaga nivalis]|uniref:Thioredoxin family protein n=1 Tax=Chitinophaga nivalis TaxID=2991709 RepID=A0ABT3IWX2_9BACT|nr:thioredoxin family protein [Chitinophaga nivalis]MCW3461828.1 thioredoxin family protein [Chitinophaga nivalis]MCW3488478.1 thioredoxin family protein [Chitinophaga nivalis]
MKKYVWMLLLSIGFAIPAAQAQTQDLAHIYNPTADAKADLAAAVKKAAKENKHVLLQIGGNWCIWCKRLYKFVDDHTSLKAAMEKDYVVYHLNYSKENKNLPILKELGYPQRFGFPVLVVLDAQGKRLHTQNSGLLESADSYDEKKLQEFFKQWSPAALLPSNYINE